MIPLCAEHGIAYQAFSPLAGGWLTGKYRRGEEAPAGSRMTMRPEPYRHLETDGVFDALEGLERGAAERGVSTAGLALAWALGGTSSVVVGPRRPEHLEPVREALGPVAFGGRARGSRLGLPMLILTGEEVVQLLDMPGCMAAMEETLVALAGGRFHLPLRPVVRPPGESHLLGLMPTFRSGDRPLYALKTVVVVPDNAARGLDPHQGTVTLYDGDHRRGRRGDEREPDHGDPHRGGLRGGDEGAGPRGRPRAGDRRRRPSGLPARGGDAGGPPVRRDPGRVPHARERRAACRRSGPRRVPWTRTRRRCAAPT